MPTISPTITTHATPGIEIIVVGVATITWEAFLQTLGPTVYEIDELYYYSDEQKQLFSPISYSIYNASGSLAGNPVWFPISPQQYQNSIVSDLRGYGVYINGDSGLGFILQPGNYIQWIFWGKRKRAQDAIDSAGYINNFKKVESEMGLRRFFENQGQGPLDQAEIEFVEG